MTPFYCTSACNTCREWWSFTNSVHSSVRPMSVLYFWWSGRGIIPVF